ncbi:copper-transporting ATPase PAA1, chloroplastic isoform X2 [Brachypodium distachyon]|uniref:HMA domain-containing protein n=1 Tax=Brachypodium distachyon TaxID=15368 RepID=I1H4X4_BRADI|nr:copper-transporting ATPase PAA1, chloroplastic isoform X2 [Brachypodium distachyon]KQK21452.1 hypothetical protein BRADI_1g60840v3 [Brachypodium distachyon]|eukprot:XP_003561581.1 copper-transporting ATPase PAA1, chloroplastic isoform X2 [Brachypodium distachyon]
MEPAVITTGATLAISAARRILVVPSPRVFASIGGGGGGGIRFFGGGGGGGGREGGDSGASGAAAAAAAAALGEEAGTADADVILLHVEGMSCGGCAANVKRILESQPEVASATVDFEKAAAVVWTTPEAKATKDWHKLLGEKLANHLSSCGFQSHLHDEAEGEPSQFGLSRA